MKSGDGSSRHPGRALLAELAHRYSSEVMGRRSLLPNVEAWTPEEARPIASMCNDMCNEMCIKID